MHGTGLSTSNNPARVRGAQGAHHNHGGPNDTIRPLC